jgi:hypothetical protein
MSDKYLRWIEQHNTIASTLASMRESEFDRAMRESEFDRESDIVADWLDWLESDEMLDAARELTTATLRHN